MPMSSISCSAVAVNYIDNEVVTMDQENRPMKRVSIFSRIRSIMSVAQPRPCNVYEQYGDLWQEGFKRVISPITIPRCRAVFKIGRPHEPVVGEPRQVGGNTVYVNAQPVVTPAAMGSYSCAAQGLPGCREFGAVLPRCLWRSAKDNKVMTETINKKTPVLEYHSGR